MATSQLQIYNDALILCEDRMLSGLTEARKPRYLLDQVWNNNGVKACLEEAMWTFGNRTQAITYDPNIQSPFGYLHAFKHPDDYIRTTGISADPYLSCPLTQYSDERGYWWCDLQTLYVKYVSNDENYGQNLTLWTESFKDFVVAHFAEKIVGDLSKSEEVVKKVMLARKNRLASARSKDAINEPPGFFPQGKLTSARRGSSRGYIDSSNTGVY